MHDYVNALHKRKKRALNKAPSKRRLLKLSFNSIVYFFAFVGFAFTLINAFHNQQQHIEDDLSAFSKIYEQKGMLISEGNAPFILTISDAYDVMNENSPPAIKHSRSLFIISDRERYARTLINGSDCKQMMMERSQMLPVYNTAHDALSYITQTQHHKGTCLLLKWEDSVTPFFSMLHFDAMPNDASSYIYFQKLPKPTSMIEAIKAQA